MPTRKPNTVYQRRQLSPEDVLAHGVSSMQINSNSPNSHSGDGDGDGRRTRFDDMGLKPELLRGIYSYGLEKPGDIQQLAIVPGTQGKDLILQAQSGMGKTAAMVIMTLQRVRPENPACQVLVLVPTRELALQIKDVFAKLGQYMDIKLGVYIGGTGKSREQHAQLRQKGTHVIVSTLGRLANMIREAAIDPLSVETFVMDEADKMLVDGSFRPDVKLIVSTINARAQVILMSATMPPTALKYAHQITRNPKLFLIPSFQLTLEGISQFYVNVGNNDDVKLDTLHELLPIVAKKHTLVFCNTRKRVRSLFTKLIGRGHAVGSIEGKQVQANRLSALERFRSTAVSTLITSELLGRGIDVQQVFLVINYDMPSKLEEYIHRVGRAGRYGRQGVAITFVTDNEMSRISGLQAFYETKIVEMPINITSYMN